MSLVSKAPSLKRLGKLFGSGRSRFLLIVLIAVLAVMAMAIARNTSESAPSEVPDVPSRPFVPGGKVQQESPAYQKALDQDDTRRASEAEERGSSAMPTLGAPEDQPQETPPTQQTSEPTYRPSSPTAPAGHGGAGAAPVDTTALAQAMQEQMRGLFQAWSPARSEAVVLMPRTAPGNPGSQTESARSGAAGAEVPRREAAPAVLIPAGAIHYAVLVTSSNSDAPGPVTVEILQGPFRGARLVGSFTRPQNADRLVVQFNSLTDVTGRSYPVNAVAVSPQTSETAVASDVDPRLVERYGLRMAAAFVAGLGEALGSAGSTSVSTIFGTTTTSQDSVGLGTAAAAGLGEAAGAISSDLEGAAAVGPLVTLDAGDPLGVLYVESVTLAAE